MVFDSLRVSRRSLIPLLLALFLAVSRASARPGARAVFATRYARDAEEAAAARKRASGTKAADERRLGDSAASRARAKCSGRYR